MSADIRRQIRLIRMRLAFFSPQVLLLLLFGSSRMDVIEDEYMFYHELPDWYEVLVNKFKGPVLFPLSDLCFSSPTPVELPLRINYPQKLQKEHI